MRSALHLAFALPFALSLSACSSSTTTPADTPQADTAGAQQQAIPAGLPVYVNRGGQWLAATVVRQTGPRSVLIHYEGAPAEYDEDVPFERVRSRPGAEPASTEYKSGESVLVSSQNRLYLAEVRQQLEGGNYRVRYSGYGAEAVENVPADRIQRLFTGTTVFPVGTPVQITAGAQTYPGKVIAAVRADQWIVRLDNAGPEYDQIVGPDRIRPLPPPAPAAPAPAATPAAPTASAAPAAPATTAPATAPAAGATKAPEPAPESFKPGDAVLLQVRSVYYPAKVVGPGAAQGTLKVRVEGATADEEVQQKLVARLQDPLKGVKYKAGQEIFIEWHGVWAPGKIVKEADTGNYKVRAEGKGNEADEIVPVKRIRPRK